MEMAARGPSQSGREGVGGPQGIPALWEGFLDRRGQTGNRVPKPEATERVEPSGIWGGRWHHGAEVLRALGVAADSGHRLSTVSGPRPVITRGHRHAAVAPCAVWTGVRPSVPRALTRCPLRPVMTVRLRGPLLTRGAAGSGTTRHPGTELAPGSTGPAPGSGMRAARGPGPPASAQAVTVVSLLVGFPFGHSRAPCPSARTAPERSPPPQDRRPAPRPALGASPAPSLRGLIRAPGRVWVLPEASPAALGAPSPGEQEAPNRLQKAPGPRGHAGLAPPLTRRMRTRCGAHRRQWGVGRAARPQPHHCGGEGGRHRPQAPGRQQV